MTGLNGAADGDQPALIPCGGRKDVADLAKVVAKARDNLRGSVPLGEAADRARSEMQSLPSLIPFYPAQSPPTVQALALSQQSIDDSRRADLDLDGGSLPTKEAYGSG